MASFEAGNAGVLPVFPIFSTPVGAVIESEIEFLAARRSSIQVRYPPLA